jgi:hypothetical protein
MDSSRDDGGDPMDDNYDRDDIAPEALVSMRADCDAFADENAADLALYAERMSDRAEWSWDERAGHDFWLTRNGHGAGFWDRGLGNIGDSLSEACRAFGSSDLYVGDDGKVYIQ